MDKTRTLRRALQLKCKGIAYGMTQNKKVKQGT
jgi:hypothetical protein